MQQTENWKLNLIETGDPISPQPLNENAEKIEAALFTKTDETRTDGLEQRVVALEAQKIYLGSYIGDGAVSRDIDLGFAPKAVLILTNEHTLAVSIFLPGMKDTRDGYTQMALTENGFHIGWTNYNQKYNYRGQNVTFLALA